MGSTVDDLDRHMCDVCIFQDRLRCGLLCAPRFLPLGVRVDAVFCGRLSTFPYFTANMRELVLNLPQYTVHMLAYQMVR